MKIMSTLIHLRHSHPDRDIYIENKLDMCFDAFGQGTEEIGLLQFNFLLELESESQHQVCLDTGLGCDHLE